ncbi:hypothetical protein H0H92_011378 [Tricholoma furcatifolium]|nr:hypothetical protein H0H92_011378 [Tricholoma furcatifolium]
MSSPPQNAVAGPSSPRSSQQQLFLPPPPPPRSQQTHLASTQDLVTRFNLLPAYDKYVRPHTESPLDPLLASNGMVDKGKGKETDGVPTPGAPDGPDADDDDPTKEKKQKNNYKHLIKGMPGKHSMKKDDYLTQTMEVPPKQRIQIAPFDSRTQREAFTVSLEGLKGWNPNALILESAQAREDRKKRKEAKRLQKLQAQGVIAAPVAQPQPIPASAASRPSISNGTPRPGSTVPLVQPTPVTAVPPTHRPSSAMATSRPGSAAPSPSKAASTPRPGSTVPRPGSAAAHAKSTLPPVQTSTTIPRVSTPLRSATTATPTSSQPYQTTFDDRRGVKREREDSGPPPGSASQPPINGVGVPHVNGHGNGLGLVNNVPKVVMNAKAGTAGVRPRPVKKQRMDMQGQAGVTVTQQPTPQGV